MTCLQFADMHVNGSWEELQAALTVLPQSLWFILQSGLSPSNRRAYFFLADNLNLAFSLIETPIKEPLRIIQASDLNLQLPMPELS